MVFTAVRHAAVKTRPSVIQPMASVNVNLATMATTANTVSLMLLLLLFKTTKQCLIVCIYLHKVHVTEDFVTIINDLNFSVFTRVLWISMYRGVSVWLLPL